MGDQGEQVCISTMWNFFSCHVLLDLGLMGEVRILIIQSHGNFYLVWLFFPVLWANNFLMGHSHVYSKTVLKQKTKTKNKKKSRNYKCSWTSLCTMATFWQNLLASIERNLLHRGALIIVFEWRKCQFNKRKYDINCTKIVIWWVLMEIQL